MSLLSNTFFQHAATYGVQQILIKPRERKIASSIGIITADAVVEEHHIDTAEITTHPVEIGSMISDHAYMRPSEVVLHLAWSLSTIPPLFSISTGNASADSIIAKASSSLSSSTYNIYKTFTSSTDKLKDTYEKLRQLQSNFIPFSIFTGKRLYKDMLCRELIVETDNKKEDSLFARMTCQQVLLVNTFTAKPQDVKIDLPRTASPTDTGSVTPSLIDIGKNFSFSTLIRRLIP